MSFDCSTQGVDGALRLLVVAVDCNARGYSKAGFLALTGPDSFFPGALTALMVILVALIGLRMLFGFGPRLITAPLIALQIGAVLALTLQWPLFQTLVFNVAYKGPLDIASATLGHGTTVDPLGAAQAVYDILLRDVATLDPGTTGTTAPGAGPKARAAAELAGAARILFFSTAGALSVALVAIAILVTVGPVFIALLLIPATRGLFVGWLRALIAAAIGPMVIWANTALMIEVITPNLDPLAEQVSQATPDMARIDSVVTTIEVFAGAQVALVILGLIVAMGLRFGGLRAMRGDRQGGTLRTSQSEITLPRTQQLAEALRSPSALRGVTAGGAASDGVRSVQTSTTLRDRVQAATAPVAQGERTGEKYRRARFDNRRGTLKGMQR